MNVTPEQIQATTKANVDAFLSLATSQFAAIEKFASLNANAVKSVFEDSIANARALAGAKDVQELVNLQSTFAQPAIEKAIAYSKSVYEVATQNNTEFTKASERRVTEWNENFVSLLDKAAKNAPGRIGRRRERGQADARRRELGLRQLQQGHQAGDRNGGSECCRRDRDRERPRQSKKSGLSAKRAGKKKARTSAKTSQPRRKAAKKKK